MPKFSVGIAEGVVVFAYVIVGTFLWRAAAGALADKPIGKAMAAVYS